MCILSTSISHNRIKHQIQCLKTWEPYVDEVYAIQLEGESDKLEPHFPGWVEWIEVPRRHHKYARVLIDDHFQLCKKLDAPVILTNSDIENNYDDSHEFDLDWKDVPKDCFQIGVRWDYDEKSYTRIDVGVDVFRLTPDLNLPDFGFCIGNPVWDLWLPYHALTLGKTLRVNPAPVLTHKIHKSSWGSKDLRDNWRTIGLHYPGVDVRNIVLRFKSEALLKGQKKNV